MQRPKEIAVALLVAALLVGGALGYATGRFTAARESAPGEHGAMRKYLAARLDLTPAQVSGVDSILDARHREMTRLIAPVQPGLDSARANARRQIIALLNPDQQLRFQKMVQHRDSAMARTPRP